jgi:short-subunit dehydrogenase
MTNLTNKVAVITGSANGLGKALATELFRQDYHLALLDIDLNELEKVKTALQSDHRKITIYKVDISREEQIISAQAEILEKYKRVDILINNAGVSMSQTFDKLELADYRWLFEINFWGTVYCTKHFLPYLKQQKDSRLVNIISNFAFVGFPGKTAYESSKSAIMGFTNALRTELAKTAVKVSLVIPPPLNTGLVINNKHTDDIKRKNEARFLEKNGMPLDLAARKIISKVKAGKFRIVIGAMMFWIDFASRLFPTTLHRLIGNNKKRFDFV